MVVSGYLAPQLYHCVPTHQQLELGNSARQGTDDSLLSSLPSLGLVQLTGDKNMTAFNSECSVEGIFRNEANDLANHSSTDYPTPNSSPPTSLTHILECISLLSKDSTELIALPIYNITLSFGIINNFWLFDLSHGVTLAQA